MVLGIHGITPGKWTHSGGRNWNSFGEISKSSGHRWKSSKNPPVKEANPGNWTWSLTITKKVSSLSILVKYDHTLINIFSVGVDQLAIVNCYELAIAIMINLIKYLLLAIHNHYFPILLSIIINHNYYWPLLLLVVNLYELFSANLDHVLTIVQHLCWWTVGHQRLSTNRSIVGYQPLLATIVVGREPVSIIIHPGWTSAFIGH